jgi:hypothetical protein
MRLEPSDPDIETVVTRIERGDLDLQPEFQRGEVWSKAKKQRLIDSVLREWHIPPLHVIELKESRRQEVLDGQQRLAASRDFVRGEFPVDGSIEPLDPEIQKLSGKRFRELPEDWKRRFNQFTLRVFRIVDYRAEEPGELFFRLNQPTSLTAAEQRNAFFGPVRAQIKELVDLLGTTGVDRGILGFSNSRMAYDDVLARVCLTVKRRSMAEKVTASTLITLYRSEERLPPTTVEKVKGAIDLFGAAQPSLTGQVQLNKATVYSWFLFAIRANTTTDRALTSELLGEFMRWYEFQRIESQLGLWLPTEGLLLTDELLRIYADRSAARVADVSSVILRDAIIWLGFEAFLARTPTSAKFPLDLVGIQTIHAAYVNVGSPFEDDTFARELIQLGWGGLR